MATKRAASPTQDAPSPKQIRADSHVPDTDDEVIFVRQTVTPTESQEQEQEQDHTNSDRNDDVRSQSGSSVQVKDEPQSDIDDFNVDDLFEEFSAPLPTIEALPPLDDSFVAPITVNSKQVGTLTVSKITLNASDFTSFDGSKAPIARPTKRVLRLGGSDAGINGFNITLPKTPCREVTIEYTSQGCRVSIDNVVQSQQVWRVDHGKQRFLELVRKEDEKRGETIWKPVPRPDNQWIFLYNEWRTWTDAKMANIHNMETFPRMPLEVRRCTNPNCDELDERGKRRHLRFIRNCMHDLEMWFRDVAGGYNSEYKAILEYEIKKWNPSDFARLGQLNEKQAKFRQMSGEMWKYACALADEYEHTRGGFLSEWRR